MKEKKTFYMLCVFLISVNISFSQKNVLKMNMPSLLFNNYYFTAERALGDKTSFALGVSYMPDKVKSITKYVPQFMLDSYIDSELSDQLILNGGIVITPELRIYLTPTKKAPKGLYIAPFLRYSTYNLSSEYVENIQNKDLDIAVDAKWNMFGGGIMFGYQVIVKNFLTIDAGVIGIGYRSSFMKSDISSDDITSDNVEEVKDSYLDNFKEVGEVGTNTVKNIIHASIDDGLVSLRIGLSLGIAL